jgi:hypothetical protein
VNQPEKPFTESGTSPPLSVTVTRMDLTPGSTIGVGHGTDPRGRELSFGADWRCALAIREALERGEHVEVHLQGWQVLAWRAQP